MTSYTPLARCLAFVLSLAILHPQGLLAQVNVTTQGGGGSFSGGALTSATTVLDGANFSVLNTADPTKQLRFDVSGVTTATIRTLTVPNVSSTICVAGANCSFSVSQTFGSGLAISSDSNIGLDASLFVGPANGASNLITQRSAGTPDQTLLATGTTSNAWVVAEVADGSFGFNHAAQTNPTLFIHSNAASTTQWLGLTHDTTNGLISTGLGALKVSAASGMILSTGSAPTVSVCGTTPGAVAGSNTAGRLTTGSGGTVQSCTLTFVPALAAAPSCVVNDETAILLVRATATTTTLVLDSAVAGSLASQVLTYSCIGGV